ncbi:MAG: DUF2497 domain-containing protein [Kiloniellaceae bacterium]
MSSKPEAQNEPTMEEILASIRRIISEDEPQDAKPAEAAPSAPSAPPVVKAKPAVAAAPAAVAAPPQPAASVRGADNILDLTRMVTEDGSIVDLEAVNAPEEAAEAEAAAEVPEPPAEEAPDMAAEVEPEPEAAEAPEVPEVEDAAVAEPVAEEPAAEEAAQDAAEDAVEDSAADAPEEAAPAEAAPEEEAPEEEAPEEEAPAAASLVPAPVGEESEFVSAATAVEATASLAAVTKAAMANRQSDAVAIGGGRSLEDLVRQSLAPELKGWLDENLPDLVERIVREEIRKMVRRAEDQ